MNEYRESINDTEKKKRFSDHIMPRRLLRGILWAAGELLLLYVIRRITEFLWRTLYMSMPPLKIPVFVLMAILAGCFFTFCDAFRLYNDQAIKHDFYAAYRDCSYQKQEDQRIILHGDPLKNDIASLVITMIPPFIVINITVFMEILMRDDILSVSQVYPITVPAFFLNLILALIVVVSYAVSHWYVTVLLHNKWYEERLQKEPSAPEGEKTPFM